jgi:hypothetical protein
MSSGAIYATVPISDLGLRGEIILKILTQEGESELLF